MSEHDSGSCECNDCRDKRKKNRVHARWCRVSRYALEGSDVKKANCDCGRYATNATSVKHENA
jgi:hypothetical protein